MHWANFLHIYQPSVQKPYLVKRIADESYAKIFSGLLAAERARFTLNISGALCELLEKNGRKDILENINKLLESGRLELTGSAKYHAFLPLIPEEEIERQIILNEETLRKYFGDNWKKSGFFPPEMAYSKKVAEIVRKLGYKWIIIDEMGFPEAGKIKHNAAYEIEGSGDFGVFFRDRNLSFKILSASAGSSLPKISQFMSRRFGEGEYAVTAMDGETFGHHRPGLEKLLFDLFKEENIKPATLSEISETFKNKEKVEPRPSTWASVPRDFKINQPYLRWNGKENEIQQWQWDLLNLAVKVAGKSEDGLIRAALDQALHSDQFWWSSARPWWSLEWMERGACDLKEVVKKSKRSTEKEKERSEELYRKIIYTGFAWQRTGLVDELGRNENEEIRERLEEKEKFFMTEEEYEEMIKTMTEQMLAAAKAGEYHRAAEIKDRIAELKEEMKEGEARPKANDLMF